MRISVKLPPLIIPESASPSNVLEVSDFSHLDGLLIGAPAALTGTVTIQGRIGATWYAIQTIAAAAAVAVTNTGFDAFRVNSSGSEAAARTFVVRGWEEEGAF